MFSPLFPDFVCQFGLRKALNTVTSAALPLGLCGAQPHLAGRSMNLKSCRDIDTLTFDQCALLTYQTNSAGIKLLTGMYIPMILRPPGFNGEPLRLTVIVP